MAFAKTGGVIPALAGQADVGPETLPGEAYNPNKLNPQFPAFQGSPARSPLFTLSAHGRGTAAQPATLPLLPQIQSGVLRAAGLAVSGLVAGATGEATFTLSTTYGRVIFSASILVGTTASPLATIPWALDSFIPFTDGLELTFTGITDGEISFSGVWEQCGLFTTLNNHLSTYFSLDETVHPLGCCNAQEPRPTAHSTL